MALCTPANVVRRATRRPLELSEQSSTKTCRGTWRRNVRRDGRDSRGREKYCAQPVGRPLRGLGVSCGPFPTPMSNAEVNGSQLDLEAPLCSAWAMRYEIRPDTSATFATARFASPCLICFPNHNRQ